MNAADVLDRAADVIVERGWCQHDYVPEGARDDSGLPLDDCPVCPLGAIGLVEWGDVEGYEYHESSDSRALIALREFLGCFAIQGWNDAPGRTADEAITALRECAASLRATP